VDDPKVKVSDKRNFINRQLNLISNFSNHIFTPIENTEEAFLHYFIQYGLSKGNNIIIDSVRLMIEGLEMDVQRTERDGIFTESEMNAYINKMSKSFFDVTASFILSAGKYPFRDVIVTTASTKIWMIRDLIEDLEHGYINIIKENLTLYNLNVNDLLQNSNLKKCLEDEINNIIRLLLDEAKIIKQFPLRLKLFNFYTQIYYLPQLFRVKEYSFDPRKVYNKKFKNEFKAYYYSAALSLKILLIEFFS
jgi:phytoene/squalene synthetase